jgi:hypothetical protein
LRQNALPPPVPADRVNLQLSSGQYKGNATRTVIGGLLVVIVIGRVSRSGGASEEWSAGAGEGGVTVDVAGAGGFTVAEVVVGLGGVVANSDRVVERVAGRLLLNP